MALVRPARARPNMVRLISAKRPGGATSHQDPCLVRARIPPVVACADRDREAVAGPPGRLDVLDPHAQATLENGEPLADVGMAMLADYRAAWPNRQGDQDAVFSLPIGSSLDHDATLAGDRVLIDLTGAGRDG